MKFAKAIPWAFLGRLSLKGLSFLWVASATVILFGVKALAFLSAPKADRDQDEGFAAYLDAGKYPHLPPTDFTQEL